MKRKCNKCGEIKSTDDFYDDFFTCKQCRIAYSRAKYLPIKEGVRQRRQSVYRGSRKICRVCKRWLSLDNYCDKLDNWDNLNHACRGCEILRGKEYYAANSEKSRAGNRERYRNNPEKKLKANSDWRKNNPEKAHAIWHRYKARKFSADGGFTYEQFAKLLEYYCPDGMCLGCGKRRKLTIDHIVPLFRGGTNFITNIQPICQSCNSRKGDEIIVDYRPDLGLFAQSLMENDK